MRVALSVILILLVSSCATTDTEPPETTAAEPVTTTTVAATTSTVGATTTTMNPAFEPILGTWFRWIPVAQGAGNQPLHGHQMIEFIENGMTQSGFQSDPQPLQTANWMPFTFDGELLGIIYTRTLTGDECTVAGIYELIWLSDDAFRLEAVDDDCERRVETLSSWTPADVTYEFTWRRRTEAVRDELALLNEAIENGGRFVYHPHTEGPRIPAYEGG